MDSDFQTKIIDQTLYIFINTPRLDASSSSHMKKELDFKIPQGVNRAQVDMKEVQFIDSSGVGVLLGIYRKLPVEGAEVLLINVHSGVQAVLELLRLHRIFKVQ